MPKDFGDKKLIWTLTANGKTVSMPFGVTKGYQIEPFLDAAMGNKPPMIKFSETGAALTGPPPPLSQAPVVNGAVGENVAIKYWITDDGHEEPPTGGSAAAPPPAGGAAAGPAAPPARQHDADEVPRSRRDHVRRQHADDREGHGQHDRDVLAAG